MKEREHISLQLYGIALISGITAILLSDHYRPLLPVAIILVWPAFISGAHAVRQIAGYGLGTGTSSIGYWGTAVGATMVFIFQSVDPAYSAYFGISGALVVGAATGIAAQKVIGMRIPVMIRESAILSSSTAIITAFLLGFLTGYSQVAFLIYPLIYIATTIAILHPFNGSMGAGENLKRTLHLSAVEASMTTGLFGLIAILLPDSTGREGLFVMLVSAAGFLVFLKRWFTLIKEDAYELTWTGYPQAEH